MKKSPAFQFYPDNWRNSAKLRRCSWAARGVWVEVMCLMHDSDRYGVLEWRLAEIGRSIGAPMKLMRELVLNGVLKGKDEDFSSKLEYVPRSGRKAGKPVTLIEAQKGPIWFSSRMVTDEHKRVVTGFATRFQPGDSNPRSGSSGSPKKPHPPSPTAREGERDGERQGDEQSASPTAREGDGKVTPTPRQSDGSSTPTPTSLNTRPRSINGSTLETYISAEPKLYVSDACKAMRTAGIADVNHSHPDLMALIEDGVTLAEIDDAARLAVSKQKGFAYAIAVAWGRRREAQTHANGHTNGHVVPINGHNGHEPAWRTEQKQRAAQAAPYAVAGAPIQLSHHDHDDDQP